jgi:hypothetical protein
MYNKVLKSITNRNKGFVSPIFKGNDDFSPEIEVSEQARKLRGILGLDIEDTDFYLVSALGCIESTLQIHRLFEEEVQTYDLLDYKCPLETLTDDFSLLPNNSGEIYFSPKSLEFPVAHSIHFKAHSNRTITFTYGSYTWKVPFRSRQTDHTVIFPEWPEELNIKGGIGRDYVGTDPYVGFEGDFLFCPRDYPFTTIIENIKKESLEFITNQGLVRQFYNARSNSEKIAVACWALGKTNTAVYV